MLQNQELLQKIKQLEEDLKQAKSCKRYWLVWEDKKEIFEEEAKNALPILKENKNLEIKTDENKATNLIIEWDNYHSLSALNYTHSWKIDVIYIDPPYNTWNKDFIYNDSFVDKEDSYRHSKWLSFMNKRLKLAKNLLSEKWVIFISIDDNEFAQLKMLCDDIFWENNLIWPIIWQKASWWWNSKKVVKWHEYLLCYSNYQTTLTQKNNKHLNTDYSKSSNYIEKDWKIFFINDDIVRKVFWKYENWVERRCEYEDLLIYKTEKFKAEIDLYIEKWDYILRKNPSNLNKHFICRLEEIDWKRMKLYSIIFWILNNEWKEDLEKLWLDNWIFDYPKPTNLVKFILDSIDSKSSIILDFFAWSWTTGQAVMELNKEDWWNRQFILCSNRENTKENPDKNICKNITYERNKRIIEGYTNNKWEKIQGLWWNLKYYKTEFIKIQKSTDDLRYSFINMCDDLLCIKENTFEKMTPPLIPPQVRGATSDSEVGGAKDFLKFYKNSQKITAILYDIHHFIDLIEILKNLDWNIFVYIFSLSKDIYEEEISYLNKNITIQNIPDNILQTYKKIFEM